MSKLCLSNDKKIAGVCAGVAEFFGLDTPTVRLVWLVLAIVGVGSPVLFYILLWLLLPGADGGKMSYEERMNRRLRK